MFGEDLSKDIYHGDHTLVVNGDLTLDVSGDIILSKDPTLASVEITETYAGIAANFISIDGDMKITAAGNTYLEITNNTANSNAVSKLVIPIITSRTGTVLKQVTVGYKTSEDMNEEGEVFGFYSHNVTGMEMFSETGFLLPAPPPALAPSTGELNFTHTLSGNNSNQVVIDLSFGAARWFRLYYVRCVYDVG